MYFGSPEPGLAPGSSVEPDICFFGSPEPGLARRSSGEPESRIFGSPEPGLARSSSGELESCILVYRSQSWLLAAPMNRIHDFWFIGSRPGSLQLR